MPWWALLGSIVATETSTVTFLSIPGLSYSPDGDLRFLQLAVGFLVGRCLVVVLLLPAYFRGEMFSAYEVLRRRFGGGTQRLAAGLFLVTRNLGDGLRLFLAALVVQHATGLSLLVSVLLVGAVTIVYTLLGGMRSVVWNDCLQWAVYMTGAFLALGVMVARLPGGWEQLGQYAAAHDKLRWLDFHWRWSDPFTFWAGLIGGAFLSLGTHGVDQLIVQRYLAASSFRDAARALIASGVVVIVQFALFLLVGITLACYFEQFPPKQPIGRGDEAFAAFIVHHMPRGATGLTLAAVFAAAMSTLSSSLNSSAASALNDLGFWRGEDVAAARRRLRWCRGLTIAFGAVQMAVALGAQYSSQSVINDALTITGFTTGVLLGIFGLGQFSRVGPRAALAGVAAGIAAVTAVKFCTPLAWPWFTVAGALATVLIGWAAGTILHEKKP